MASSAGGGSARAVAQEEMESKMRASEARGKEPKERGGEDSFS